MSTSVSSIGAPTQPENPETLLKQLLESVQKCQRKYGGKTELATEFDACVAGLCVCLEAVFFHGFKQKIITSQSHHQLNPLKQVSEIVAQSLNIKQDIISNSSFWQFIEKHLTKHEKERFNILKNVWTDIGKCKAWIRAALNEKALERYFHTILADKKILNEYYENWSLLRDEDKNSMLPNMAAGLGSILFAISIDKIELNASVAPRPVGTIGYLEEPIIQVPVPRNKDHKDKTRRKVARQTISFDDDDSVLSTSVLSISSSSSDNSGLGSTSKFTGIKNRTMEHFNVPEEAEVQSCNISSQSADINETSGRKLSIENIGSRRRFSTNLPELLTPINQSSIGELTPVNSGRTHEYESPDTSDDILEVPTDISAVLTVVENRNQEEINKRDEKIQLLSKENDGLKEQIKKYVNAIQMLKTDDEIDELDLESLPNYKREAKVYEQKLVQVAEMHAELMDFNVMLQKSLRDKDALLDQLKNELEIMRGPFSLDELENHCGNINVWIPSAFLTGSGSNSHHVYQIFLRAGNDEWNIYRRYAQFHALHSDLKKLDPAVSNFNFPPKKSIGNKDASLVEDRRKRLQTYLRKIIAHWPELNHCASRFLLEQHLAFFKDQPDDEAKKNLFSSRRSAGSGNYSGL